MIILGFFAGMKVLEIFRELSIAFVVFLEVENE